MSGDEKIVHMVWVTATVTYKLGILATSEDDAIQEARDVWHGNNGHTVKEWKDYYGSQWHDVVNIEFNT